MNVKKKTVFQFWMVHGFDGDASHELIRQNGRFHQFFNTQSCSDNDEILNFRAAHCNFNYLFIMLTVYVLIFFFCFFLWWMARNFRERIIFSFETLFLPHSCRAYTFHLHYFERNDFSFKKLKKKLDQVNEKLKQFFFAFGCNSLDVEFFCMFRWKCMSHTFRFEEKYSITFFWRMFIGGRFSREIFTFTHKIYAIICLNWS